MTIVTGGTESQSEKRITDSKKNNDKAFVGLLGTLATCRVFDEGLADLLNVETLRHGTNPLSFLSINLLGARSGWGGSVVGSSAGVVVVSGDVERSIRYRKNSSNFFHLFKDSESPNRLGAILNARMHATLSGAALGVSKAGSLRKISAAIGGLMGALTPTLKFRFKLEELIGNQQRFADDPDYYDNAYRTARSISPARLGITGSLIAGIDAKTVSRMLSNPLKVLRGVVLLTTACVMGKALYSYLRRHESETVENTNQEEVSRIRSVFIKIAKVLLKIIILCFLAL